MTHVPRKRFGQNFLRDNRIISGIADAVRPQAGDHIVEIGPGQGAITRLLARSPARLSLVEIDRDLAEFLPLQDWWTPEITLHREDALKVRWDTLEPQPLRIVGNLPYNISTPLLFHLLDSAATIVDMHLMLQKEVVQRLCASPGTSAWGRLSVAAQMRARMQVLLDVPPGCFFPPPKVQSQVVRVTPLQPQPEIPAPVDELLRLAFGARRKTLRKALANRVNAAQWEQAEIDAGLRAEVLDIGDWMRLARIIEAADYTARSSFT